MADNGDVRAERSEVVDKVINVRLFAGCYNPGHTRVGHAQISGNIGTGITQLSYRNPRFGLFAKHFLHVRPSFCP
jgi:hypothetical protein